MTRVIHKIYQDPLDLIWIHCAYRLGWNVEASTEVYASWDGKNTLSIASATDRDEDDSIAQLIFHEICHALVAGSTNRQKIDWGLSNFDHRDLNEELACHRVQAGISALYELRQFMAVTTEWRPYYNALPKKPLTQDLYQDHIILDAGLQLPNAKDRVMIMQKVQRACQTLQEDPWYTHVHQALLHTQKVYQIVNQFDGHFKSEYARSLWIKNHND